MEQPLSLLDHSGTDLNIFHTSRARWKLCDQPLRIYIEARCDKLSTMDEKIISRDKHVLFGHFENTLSSQQRHFLLQNPDLLHPDLVGALYQASLSRLSQDQLDVTDRTEGLGRSRPLQSSEKKPRKVVNSWMAFRCMSTPFTHEISRLTIYSLLLSPHQGPTTKGEVTNHSTVVEVRCGPCSLGAPERGFQLH